MDELRVEKQGAVPIALTQVPGWLDTLRVQSAAMTAFHDNAFDILQAARLRATLRESDSTRESVKALEDRLLAAPDEPSEHMGVLMQSDLFRRHVQAAPRFRMLGLGGFVAGSVLLGGGRGIGLTATSRTSANHPGGRVSYALASLAPNVTFLVGMELSAWFTNARNDTPFIGAQLELTGGMGGAARIYFNAGGTFDPAPIGFSVGVGLALGALPAGLGIFYGRFSELTDTR